MHASDSTRIAGCPGRWMHAGPRRPARADIPHHPEIWTDVCGWYSFRGSLRDAQKWFAAGAEVFVRRGQLTLRPVTALPALARGPPLHPDDPGDPYVFRIDLSSLGLGTSRVVFSLSPHAIVECVPPSTSASPRCRSTSSQPPPTPGTGPAARSARLAQPPPRTPSGGTGNTRRCVALGCDWVSGAFRGGVVVSRHPRGRPVVQDLSLGPGVRD